MTVRVELDLDETLLESLTRNASEHGLSLAKYITHALESAQHQPQPNPRPGDDLFLTLPQMMSTNALPSAPFDFETFDEILAREKGSDA